MLRIWLAESSGNWACILEHFTNISWETIYSINTDKNQTGLFQILSGHFHD